MTDTDVVPAVPARPTRNTSGPRRRAWTVTTLLVVFMMVNFADKSVLGLAAESIRADLGMSASAFGLANSAFFLLFSVCGAAVGLLADRVRPKWLLLAMALLWSVAQAPLALGGGIALLVASRVLLGAAEGPAFPVAQQTAMSWFPDRARNLPGALVVLGTTLGVLLAAPGLTWVIDHHGWHSAFAVVAVAGLVWALLWGPLGGEGPYASGAPDHVRSGQGDALEVDGIEGAARRTPYRRIIATRTWIGATAAYFGAYWITAFGLVWLPSYLHEGLGLSTAGSARVLMLVYGLNAVVVLGQAGLTGWLLRRGAPSRRARGGLGGALLLISAAACLALPGVPAGAASVVLLVVGFSAAGAMTSIAVTTVTRLTPADRRGGALGIMNAVVTTAGLIAPTLIGQLVDAYGADGYRYAVLLTGALLLLGGTAAVTLIDPDRDARRLAG
ncbi:MFS transporter [Streptomyces sp. NPDC007110]|uniref:MFS transporter n=1 Tax=Streptomyces sp. NPDC007110 TaxID=3156916 RepID=UPI0033C818E8